MFRSLKFQAARAAGFVAAFVASAAVMAALAALFHAASARPFLRDSASVRLALAACEAAGQARSRGDCVHAHLARAEARRAATVTALAKPPPDDSAGAAAKDR